jgi:hypothetical protein
MLSSDSEQEESPPKQKADPMSIGCLLAAAAAEKPMPAGHHGFAKRAKGKSNNGKALDAGTKAKPARATTKKSERALATMY